MNREVHVRFWESAGVRFHCATHLPACLREHERCPRRHRPMHQLLQLAPAALKPSSSNSGRGVLRIAASAFGRSSLTPQGPLKNYRDLFRSRGPALASSWRSPFVVFDTERPRHRLVASVRKSFRAPVSGCLATKEARASTRRWRSDPRPSSCRTPAKASPAGSDP